MLWRFGKSSGESLNNLFGERARWQVMQQHITEHDLTLGLRVLERIKRLDRAGKAHAIAFFVEKRHAAWLQF